MDELDDAILRHYETIEEEDRISTGYGQLELLRVREILSRYLPPPPGSILDVGGATGVHARWLAEIGYAVRIIDISPKHVARANAELGSLGVIAERGDARSLAAPDDSCDAVLLFGPLYHLTEGSDRQQALAEARRVVRAGGVVAVAAVSRFAPLFDGLARGYLFESDFVPIVERDLAEGQHRNPDERAHWFTTAFMHHPDQLRQEVADAGFTVSDVFGVEGMGGWLRHLAARWEDTTDRDRILWAARMVENEPTLMGLSAHLLLVALKP
jgi:ubiquinone/menaquinone biosynthesis C-methylase UbiE